jgi:hypothetical protein
MDDGEDRNRQKVIAGLNEALAGEYRVIADYATSIALLRAEVADRQCHARALADTILSLGGEPTEGASPMRPGPAIFASERAREALTGSGAIWGRGTGLADAAALEGSRRASSKNLAAV